MNELNNKLDKIIGDIYMIGRSYVLLSVNDFKTLRPGIKQALIELVAEAYENGRKAGIAENQFETINRLRKSRGKSPITLAELSSNKQGGSDG